MNQARIAILSSVKPRCFSQFDWDPRFTPGELSKALLPEKEVWKNAVEIDYLRENTHFEVINVLEWLPRKWEYDGYILWGSPSMVTERLPWMKDLERFIHQEVSSGKPALWICFWHQILANSFWGRVEYAHQRKIWRWRVFLNTHGRWDEIFSQLDDNFTSLWSHSQYVCDVWEGVSLWENKHTPNQIIKIGEHAWGVQFHPEFAPEFGEFLVKLMSLDIQKEWWDVEKILQKIRDLKKNEWWQVVTLFLESILNKN